MSTTECQLACVTIDPLDEPSPDDESAVRFVVPAYTVPLPALRERVVDAFGEYERRTQEEAPKRASLADFAFYLLALATTDPRTQEETT